jgi:hypothetical protein
MNKQSWSDTSSFSLALAFVLLPLTILTEDVQSFHYMFLQVLIL